MKDRLAQILNFKAESFKYRKAVQTTLVVSMIFFQIILLIIIYNEIFNEPKLEELEAEIHISEQVRHFSDLTKDNYMAAQYNLQHYIQTKDDQYLVKYNTALDSLSKNIQNLVKTSDKSSLFSLHLNKDKDKDSKLSIESINDKIDSLRVIETKPPPTFDENLFKLDSIKYDDIVDSLKVETIVTVDSIQRKGLFSRLGNAISGKVDVQKEKSNVVLTLRKGKNISSGSVKEQMEKLVISTNKYYQQEFEKYKRKLEALNNKKNTEEDIFLDVNNKLLTYSNMLVNKYNDALFSYTNDARKKFQEQYNTNKKIRNYSVIGLIFFIIIISIMLAFLTRLSFIYEKRLVWAKDKIQKNLNFKNRIVGMISHEIRSPLHIISIYCQGISRKIKDEELQDSIKSIEFTTQSLSLLANQILDFSQNENKKLELNKEVFNLKHELNEILKTLEYSVAANDNKMTIQNSVQESVRVFSDATKIHQLFYNIVGNANKFTQKGQIEVSIFIEDIDTDKKDLLVIIKDNGLGIDEEDLKYVFESFHQSNVSANMKNFGIGLGLNLCKEIVELFDGNITITSKPNVETVVTFNIVLDTAK